MEFWLVLRYHHALVLLICFGVAIKVARVFRSSRMWSWSCSEIVHRTMELMFEHFVFTIDDSFSVHADMLIFRINRSLYF